VNEQAIFVPSSRRIFEQSWWIASELARRQSHLRVFESHFGGIYDQLLIAPDLVPIPFEGSVDLNREGTLHTHVAGDDGMNNLTWADALAAESPHHIVQELERRMGWKVRSADATTTRSLTYRVLSRLLTRTLNDRETWAVRQIGPDNGWLNYPKEQLMLEFGSASAQYGHLAVGRPGLWAVQRDEKVVMVVGEDAQFHPGGSPIELMPTYEKRKRIDDVVGLMMEA
jgi:hypothetical protein